jgi:hypothetical protein
LLNHRTHFFGIVVLLACVFCACGGQKKTPTCSANRLEACEYPSRDVAYTEQRGFATSEPVTGRTLPLVARLPKLEGPLPLVVWSHGGGFFAGGQNQSAEWGDVFAAHGYAVIHVGHSALIPGNVQTYCDRASIPTNECVATEGSEDENGLIAIGRSFDLVAVLDDLPRLSELSVMNDGPAFDLSRVTVAGWSGGSRGPMMVLGARNRPSPGAPLFTNAHARAAAGIFMSPAGPPYAGWFAAGSDNTWAALRGPTFTATGDNDVKPDKVDLTGTVRRQAFELQPKDGSRHLLYSRLPVGTGGHGTYNLSDQGSSNAKLGRFSRALSSAARAFLDAHMQGSVDAETWLASEHAKTLASDVDWEKH